MIYIFSGRCACEVELARRRFIYTADSKWSVILLTAVVGEVFNQF
ncbi:MAG: hypothetical protein OEZ30_10000 [Candidatus Aminicenantes bacterium]|nr:hypothetical protein [Candidatus Aminicenantes bacterium]